MLKSPVGTLTFLMTDIEGSTRMWETNPDDMRKAILRHEQIVKQVVAEHDGYLALAQGEGDSTFSVFKEATKATLAARELSLLLSLEPWPEGICIRLRTGLHSGVADL